MLHFQDRNFFFQKWCKNKAVYTAALVADGWAGAKNLEKRTLWRTDGQTDEPTNQRTEKWFIESLLFLWTPGSRYCFYGHLRVVLFLLTPGSCYHFYEHLGVIIVLLTPRSCYCFYWHWESYCFHGHLGVIIVLLTPVSHYNFYWHLGVVIVSMDTWESLSFYWHLGVVIVFMDNLFKRDS